MERQRGSTLPGCDAVQVEAVGARLDTLGRRAPAGWTRLMPEGPRRHHGAPRPLGAGARVVRVPRRVAVSLQVDATMARRSPFRPGLILVIAFAGLILVGTALLMLPFSLASGGQPDLLVALFTATSAVCVTGLTVVSTHDHWSLFGQIVILALIQVGALGFIVGAVVIFSLAGRRTATRERLMFGPAHRTRRTRRPEGPGLAHRPLYASSCNVWARCCCSFEFAAIRRWIIRTGGRYFTPSLPLPTPGLTSSRDPSASRGWSMTQRRWACWRRWPSSGAIGFTVIFDVMRRRLWRRLGLESPHRAHRHAGTLDRGISCCSWFSRPTSAARYQRTTLACGRTPRSTTPSGAPRAFPQSIWAVFIPTRSSL